MVHGGSCATRHAPVSALLTAFATRARGVVTHPVTSKAKQAPSIRNLDISSVRSAARRRTGHCIHKSLPYHRHNSPPNRSWREAPDAKTATIYALEPWAAGSPAVVSWSPGKGGLPEEAARARLTRVCEVRVAVEILSDAAAWRLRGQGHADELVALLLERLRAGASSYHVPKGGIGLP